MKKRFLARRLLALAHGVLPYNRWGDHIVGAIRFYAKHGRWPGAAMLFNDVVFRYKTDGSLSRPLQCFTVDKEYAKLYIAARIGAEHVVPTIAVLRSRDEARHYDYPDRCAIKPTHTSGRIIIRKAGEPIDIEAIVGWFDHDFYRKSREANYRHLERKVIVEPLVFDDPDAGDYKIFCVNGRARIVRLILDRRRQGKRVFYSLDWQRQAIGMNFPAYQGEIARPRCLEAMLAGAEKVAQGFEFVRIDCYCDGDRFYVGEITCCPDSAGSRFIPPEGEATLSAILFGADP